MFPRDTAALLKILATEPSDVDMADSQAVESAVTAACLRLLGDLDAAAPLDHDTSGAFDAVTVSARRYLDGVLSSPRKTADVAALWRAQAGASNEDAGA